MSSLPYAPCSPLARLPKYSGMAKSHLESISFIICHARANRRVAGSSQAHTEGARSWLRHAAWLGHQTHSTHCGQALCASLLRCAWAARPQAMLKSPASSKLRHNAAWQRSLRASAWRPLPLWRVRPRRRGAQRNAGQPALPLQRLQLPYCIGCLQQRLLQHLGRPRGLQTRSPGLLAYHNHLISACA